METVIIKKCGDYDAGLVYKNILEGINLLGGISSLINRKDKVLIKPNMLTGCRPEKAVNTHPAIIEAIAKLALETGASVAIGDSPMSGCAQNLSKIIGYDTIAEKLGLEIINFTNPINCSFKNGKIFKNFTVDKTMAGGYKIINAAKLKTHTQMYMTLSVKNMFGSVVGKDKLKWHYAAGLSYDIFAKILLELYNFTKPILNIVDGIVGMEGYGPLTGNPRHIGALILGKDGISVDRVACEIVKANPDKIPIFRASKELSIGESDLSKITLGGDKISDFKIENFIFPELEPINAGCLPDFAKNLIKNMTMSRPIIKKSICRLCKMCSQACPTSAIRIYVNTLKINYKKCIRCYCCIEACQYNAMHIKTPLLSKLIK